MAIMAVSIVIVVWLVVVWAVSMVMIRAHMSLGDLLILNKGSVNLFTFIWTWVVLNGVAYEEGVVIWNRVVIQIFTIIILLLVAFGVILRLHMHP